MITLLAAALVAPLGVPPDLDELVVEVCPGGQTPGISEARNAVRELRAADPAAARRPVTVVVHDGAYSLAAPFRLEPEDSGTAEAPVRYVAAPGARPVFSGGTTLAVTRAESGLWRASTERRFDQLFVGGRRATPAREPDEGTFRIVSVEETVLEQGEGRAPRRAAQRVELEEAAWALLAELDDAGLAQVQLVVLHKWDVTRRFVRGLDRGARRVLVDGAGMKPWNRWDARSRCWIEGLPQGLDEPGEWLVDGEGTLHYRALPGEQPGANPLVAPRLDHLVEIAGDPAGGRFVEHVTLEGLAFRHGAFVLGPEGFEAAQAAAPIDAAVQVDGARHVALVDCEVAQVGRYGVWFRAGCEDVRLERSVVRDLGAGGVRIGEGTLRAPGPLRTGKCAVLETTIREGGRVLPCAVGVWIGHSPDNRVEHCEVADFFYTGVSVGWRWGYDESLAQRNLIARNHLHHLGQGLLSDLGGVYTLGPSPGTRVVENHIHDVRTASYGGWGLYPDEGSSGILFARNLVHDTDTGGFHQHYGRENVVRGNLLAFSRDQLLQATRVEGHRSFTFTGNLCLLDREALLAGPWRELDLVMDGNLYWRLGGGEVDFAGLDLEAWRALGRDRASLVADPGLVDPRGRDFTPRDPQAAPLAAIGFEPLDLEQVGPRAPSRWR